MIQEDLEKARAERESKAEKAAKEAKSVKEATVGTQRGRMQKSATEGAAQAKVARSGDEQ